MGVLALSEFFEWKSKLFFPIQHWDAVFLLYYCFPALKVLLFQILYVVFIHKSFVIITFEHNYYERVALHVVHSLFQYINAEFGYWILHAGCWLIGHETQEWNKKGFNENVLVTWHCHQFQ